MGDEKNNQISSKTKDQPLIKKQRYAIVASLHHEETNNHPERISSLKPFDNQYDD